MKGETELEQEFYDAFDEFMDHWKGKGIKSECIVPLFILEAKIESCYYHDDYYNMLGILNHLIYDDLENIFDSIKYLEDESLYSQNIEKIVT